MYSSLSWRVPSLCLAWRSNIMYTLLHTMHTRMHSWVVGNHFLHLLHCIACKQVYRVTVEPLVHTLFNNGKATCFAYGQTGSGKTHTMSPLPIRAAADILQYLVRPELRDVSLFVSCFEIYGNKVFDLLNMRKKLNILEDGKKKVCVVGLKVGEAERARHASQGMGCRNLERPRQRQPRSASGCTAIYVPLTCVSWPPGLHVAP